MKYLETKYEIYENTELKCDVGSHIVCYEAQSNYRNDETRTLDPQIKLTSGIINKRTTRVHP